jgi:hypothetical protein
MAKVSSRRRMASSSVSETKRDDIERHETGHLTCPHDGICDNTLTVARSIVRDDRWMPVIGMDGCQQRPTDVRPTVVIRSARGVPQRRDDPRSGLGHVLCAAAHEIDEDVLAEVLGRGIERAAAVHARHVRDELGKSP